MRTGLYGLPARAVWVLVGCLVCQFGLGYSYIYGPLAPDILEEFGWSRTMFSSARAPILWVISAASPVVGALAVRFGARGILVSSTLLLSATVTALAGIQAYWQLLALNIGMGLVVAGLGDIAVGQVATRWVSRGRGLALGVVYTGSNIGGFLAVSAVEQMGEFGSWRTALVAVGIGGGALILPFALWVVREPRPGEAPAESGEAAPAQTGRATHSRSGPDMTLAAARRTRSFWILAFCLFIFFAYDLALLESFVLFLTDRGVETAYARRLFGYAVLLGFASKLCFGVIADLVPHKTAMLLNTGLLTLSSLLVFWLPAPGLLAAFVVTWGFARAARDVIYPLLVVDCFGVRYMAGIYGALMLVLAPAGTIGPIFAARVFDVLGSYEVAFAAFAAANVATLVAIGWLRRESSAMPDPGRAPA